MVLKKRTRHSSDSHSIDSDNQDSSGIPPEQQYVNATFEGRNLEEQDYHMIKHFLEQLFATNHFDISQLTDLLISQQGVGSGLKQSYESEDEDEDMDTTNELFGITSVLNIGREKDMPCIQELLSLLNEFSKKHADETVQNNFKKIVQETQKLGLIINERFVNIPPTIAVPLLTCLVQEIDSKKKKDPSYDFEYYIKVCRIYKEQPNSEFQYTNIEDELFCRESDVSFEYKSDKDSYRKVVVFKGNKLQSIVASMASFIGNE